MLQKFTIVSALFDVLKVSPNGISYNRTCSAASTKRSVQHVRPFSNTVRAPAAKTCLEKIVGWSYTVPRVTLFLCKAPFTGIAVRNWGLVVLVLAISIQNRFKIVHTYFDCSRT